MSTIVNCPLPLNSLLFNELDEIVLYEIAPDRLPKPVAEVTAVFA